MEKLNVIQLVSNRVWGGGERYVLDLTKRLKTEEVNVRVVSRGINVVDNPFLQLGVEITHAPFTGYTDLRTPQIIADLIKGFQDKEPVIIHVHDFKNAFLAIRAKKMIGTNRQIRIVVTRHLIRRGKKGLINTYIYRNIDSLIFISKAVKDEFFISRPKIDINKTVTIYNSILNPPVPEKKAGTNEQKSDCVRLLFMGRIEEEKGIKMLLESLARLCDDNWKLYIGGTGDACYIASLKKYAEENAIDNKIEWLGYVQDIWKHIKKADVGVVPSVVREAFGLTLLEFLSQGIPIVATDNGAQKEILSDGIDCLLSSPDADAYSKILKKIISDKGLREKLARNTINTYRKFDYETFFSKILNVYNNLF